MFIYGVIYNFVPLSFLKEPLTDIPAATATPAQVAKLKRRPTAADDFSCDLWHRAKPIVLSHWHKNSSVHRPTVALRLGYTPGRLHLHWSVADCWIRSVETTVNGPVSRDSCVEAFLAPPGGRGYVNLEVNAGGTVHLGYGSTAPWAEPTLRDRHLADPSIIARHVMARSSLPQLVDPELTAPCRWTLAVDLDLDILSFILGIPIEAGPGWTGNFYKCADRSSHPHWGSWAPLGGILDFHRPATFSPIQFSPDSERTI